MPHPPAIPPMTYAPTYLDYRQAPSPFADAHIGVTIANPYPAAKTPFPRHIYPTYSPPSRQIHPSLSSNNSLLEAPESLSCSSTAACSHRESERSHARKAGTPFTLSSQAERGAVVDWRIQGRLEPSDRSEKYPRSPTGGSSSPRGSARPADASVFTCTREQETTPESKDHVAWVLICLSCITPLYSVFVSLYTLVCLFLLLFSTPIRLLRANLSLRDQTSRLLFPLLNLHLRMICSHDSVVDNSRPSGAYNVPVLLVVHILSPFVSVGVAFALWIAASFWVFTAIMGNPDGTERKDDGRAAVLGVRNWWERWLARAIK